MIRRSSGRGNVRAAVTSVLYWRLGTLTGRPFAASASPSDTTVAASSHIRSGTCDMSALARSWNSVCVNPGHIAVAVTPGPGQLHRQRLAEHRHPGLAGEYVALPPRGTKPATDETLMICPEPRGTIA